MKFKKLETILISILFVFFVLSICNAKEYPKKPINFIINYGPGGGTDVMSRSLANALKKELGVEIVPRNVQGASGSKGLSAIATSKPDGYTIGNMSMVPLALVPHTLGVPYDPKDDFTYIAGYAKYLVGVVVADDAPWKNFNDLIEYARNNPGDVKIGDGTPGGFICLGLKWIEMKENIKFKWIPYNGAGPAMKALFGGEVDVTCNNPPGIIPSLESGDIRMLVSLSDVRHSDKTVPTLKELGWDFDQVSWAGVGAPKGLSKDRKEKLQEAIKRAMKSEKFIKLMEKMHVPTQYISGKEYKNIVSDYYQIWGDIIEKTGYGK